MELENIRVWRPDLAVETAEKVCFDLGLDAPTLVRFADAALFRSADVAVRVDRQHRDNFSGTRLLYLTRYFCGLGVDTTLPYEDLDPVFVGEDFCVTFYHFLPHDRSLDESIQSYHFGRGLRTIHDLATSVAIEDIASHGEIMPLSYVERKLLSLQNTVDKFNDAPPKGFTGAQMGRLRERFNFVRDTLLNEEHFQNYPKVVLHGDAHLGNIICSDNQVFLLDFEEVGFGFAFIDHLHMIFRDVLGDTDRDLYMDFARGYGQSFRDNRDLFIWLELMTFIYFTWAAQLGNESDKHHVEAIKRFSFWEKEWWQNWDSEDKKEAPHLWNANM